MTNWSGTPGPGSGWNDPQQPANYPQPWSQPPTSGGPPTPGAPYRQPWGNPTPAQGQPAPGWTPHAAPGHSPHQPWAQHPEPGGNQQPWGASQHPSIGQPPPPSGGSRKPLLIGLAVVVVAVVGFAGFRVWNGSGVGGIGAAPAMTAGEVVQGYLEALAAGDAEKAMSYGAVQPANTELLTDDILAKQNAKLPITDIRIISDGSKDSVTTFATVHYVVKFGDTVQDEEIAFTKSDGEEWKLPNTAIKIEPLQPAGTYAADDTITLFGKNFDKGPLYVFPGFLDVASTNPYLDVSVKDTVLLNYLRLGLGAYKMLPDVALNDKGTTAVLDAVKQEFAGCTGSRQLAPPNCPVDLTAERDVVEGTATWGIADLSEVKIGYFNKKDLTTTFSGQVTIPVTVQTTDGGTKTGRSTPFLSGSADMSTQPPKIVKLR